MLQKLLNRISQGGRFSTQSLAHEFGVSQELMEAMLADLTRAGYLQSVNGCEARECGNCGFSQGCRPQAKAWILANGKG